MNKELKLNTYTMNDENHGDYVVYEVKHNDGYKENVSRSVFRKLKALEIIEEKKVDIPQLLHSKSAQDYNWCKKWTCQKDLTQEEYDYLKKEVSL